MTQMIEELTRKDVVPLTKREEVIRDVKPDDHSEVVRFRFPRRAGKINSRITALDFKRTGFWPEQGFGCQDPVGDCFGSRSGPGELVDTQG